MILRTKRVITTSFVCHLLLSSLMLTSQLLASQESTPKSAADQGTQAPPQPRSLSSFSGEEGEPITISANLQEKDGEVYRLHGDVEIEFRDYTLHADEIVYDNATGKATATGHVSLDGGLHDEHLEATRAELNIRTQLGKFEDVVATTGVRFRGRNVTLTNAEPFSFTGKEVEKVGKDKYIIHHGSITSCALPDPKWTFNTERAEVDLGGSARLYHSTFRIRNIPAIYFPFASHPTGRIGRQSGFLVPTIGQSSRKGFILGDSIYWAINRSMDATIGAQYFSARGWEQTGTFRAKPSQKSFVNLNYSGVLDRGFGPSKIDQGGQDIKLNAETTFAHQIRGVTSIEYLSSFTYRLAFTENFSQAVNSEVSSVAFLSKAYKGFFFNTAAARYQNFQSTVPNDVITILHVPGVEIASVDQQFAKTPFYWSFDGAADGVSRREPVFKTDNLVGRYDVIPRASIPVFLRGWTFRPEISLRNTYYSERKSSVNGPVLDSNLNRRSIDLAVELRPPTLGRIFEKPIFDHKVKHTIEPRFSYRRVNGISNFQNVIRFDERDILSDTNELEYALVQRVFVKKAGECGQDSTDSARPCENQSREFLSWELAQRYYFDPTFGGAVVNGQSNVLTATVSFTGIAFLNEPRRFSPIVSKIRVHPTANVDGSWQLDYDTVRERINASTTLVNYRVGDIFFGGGHAFFRTTGGILGVGPSPGPDKFNQFRVLLGYGGPNKLGWSSAASVGFDANLGFLQYGSFQASHNWDCCGISTEYRRYALGTVRNENQFRFAFTLANVGTFGNLKRQEKLY